MRVCVVLRIVSRLGRNRMASAQWLRPLAACICLLLLLCSTAVPHAVADDTEPAEPASDDAAPVIPSGESWIGAEATANVWSIYSGLTWAPLGAIGEDGWRVRLVGGYGQYRYKATIDGARTKVLGQVSFGDLLAGYHASFGPLTLKMFAGVSYDGHMLTPFDPGNAVADLMIGGTGVIEAWYNLSAADWAALDLSYSTAHSSYSSRLRLGRRLVDDLSVGVEAGAYGNDASNNGRAGGFVRYAWSGGEVSASGGVSGDIAKPSTPYATVVYLSRF